MVKSRITFTHAPAITGSSSPTFLAAWFARILSKIFSRSSIFLVAAILTIASSLNPLALAQTFDSSTEDQINAILADVDALNEKRSVFSVNTGKKLGEVSWDAGFKVIKDNGTWQIVEFNQPTVPGWASSDYLIVTNDEASVFVDGLNMRIDPSLESPILIQLRSDYVSAISAKKNGFIRLLAPRYFKVAILSTSELPSSEIAAKWIITGQQSITASQRSAPVKTNTTTEIDATSLNGGLPEGLSPAIDTPANPILKPQASSEESLAAFTLSERLHVIAPGDSVSLLVYGESDLSIQNVRVPQSGRVSFPLIGSMVVAGRTTPQVEQSVAELLAQGYVKNPRLSVIMFSYRPIFIRGAVQETGSFPFSEGLTIGKAIALAGGSKNSAKRNGVSILRDGNVIEKALTIDSQTEVQSGDVISIEEELGVQENDSTYIYLHGEVASPGEYRFRRGLTVEKAIVLAGGFTIRSSKKKISVTRYADITADQEPEKLVKVRLFTLIKPGDIISVGASWF